MKTWKLRSILLVYFLLFLSIAQAQEGLKLNLNKLSEPNTRLNSSIASEFEIPLKDEVYNLQKTSTTISRPGIIIHYKWDISKWSKEYIRHLVYDTIGRIDKYWDKDTLDKDTTTWGTYVYDSLGSTYKWTYQRSGKAWANQYVDTLLMDKTGRNIYHAYYYWVGNKIFLYQGMGNFFYHDTKGKDTLNIQTEYSFLNKTWSTKIKKHFSYDTVNSYLTTRSTYSPNLTNVFENYALDSYHVNSKGEWITYKKCTWDGKKWNNYSFIDSIIWHSFNESKYEKNIQYNWKINAWEKLIHYTAKYDSFGGHMSYSRYYDKNKIYGYEIDSALFDSQGTYIGYRYYDLINNIWTELEGKNYLATYDVNKNICRRINQTYSKAVYVNETREDYSNFSTYTPISEGIEPLNAISLYPNPVTDNLSLQIKNLKPKGSVIINIFDLQGKNILHTIHEGNALSSGIILQVSGIPSGIYLLWMNINGKDICKKFIKE